MLQGLRHVVEFPFLSSHRVWLTRLQCSRRAGFPRRAIALSLFVSLPTAPAIALAPARATPPLTTAQVNFEELEDFEYWQRLCRLQTDAGEYADAQQACEQAIEIRPENASIWADHSGVMLRLEQYPEAIASADLSLTYNLENSLAFTYQCMAFQALEQYETALDKCNEALRVNGDWGNESPSLAWFHRGQILDQQGDSELALVAYERTLLLEPEDSLTLAYQCRALLGLDRYEAAIAACQDALAGNQQWRTENPSSAWVYQGIAYSRLNQPDAAIRAFDQAIAIDPENVEAWTQQGWILEQQDRATEALTSYTRAVELAPESSRALVGQCTVLNQRQRYEAAIAACQQAIQGDGDWWPPGPAQAWSEQAQALAGSGMVEEALAATNRAVGIRPDYAAAWNNRSVVLWYFSTLQATPEDTLAQLDAAAESARQAIALDTDQARPWANLGRILRSRGRLFVDVGDLVTAVDAYEDSLAAYETALSLDGNDARIWSNYSVVLWLLRRYDAALDAAAQAIRIDATDSQAWQNQGAALVALGRYDAAQSSYERAVILDEQNAVAWASLGIIQIQQNQVEAGMASLEQALAIDPEQPLALQAIDQLSQADPMMGMPQ